MGELIRNLHKISIGNAEFMIELNEGYTSKDFLIHIQNKHFRYLLKEKDFLEFAATILRAKSEQEYMKENPDIQEAKETNYTEMASYDIEQVKGFCKYLGANSICYRLIEYVGKHATIIVKPDDYQKLRDVLNNNSEVVQYEHPLGKYFDYKFLYQMQPFLLAEHNGLLYEFFFQLPCMSLTPKTWIPLDKEIQKWIWNNTEKIDDEVFILNKECRYIFTLCWCIFVNKRFNNRSRTYLIQNKELIESEDMVRLLRKVFFLYTSRLIDHLKNEEYDIIVKDYLTNTDY